MVFQPRTYVRKPRKTAPGSSDRTSVSKRIDDNYARSPTKETSPKQPFTIELVNKRGEIIQSLQTAEFNEKQAVAKAESLLAPVQLLETPVAFRIRNKAGEVL